MALIVKTMQELVDDFVVELQSRQPKLTDTSEGSVIDTLAGATAFLASEAMLIAQELFAKTFFSTANGPEVTGGPDDLQTLAVDHFGTGFSRLPAQKAIGTVVFSRPTADAGDVVILTGTVVKTAKDASGLEIRFATTQDKTLTGTTITAPVEAIVAGVNGNLSLSVPLQIETALTDPTVVCQTHPSLAFTGGSEAQTDAEYRDFIISQLGNRRLTVKDSIEAACLDVTGITVAQAVEINKPVIEYDIATNAIKSGAEFFRIPYPVVYIAGVTGTATPTQIAEALENIEAVRAWGVAVNVVGATPLSVTWTLSVTLNPLGPNYPAFSFGDFTLIEDAMSEYIHGIAIGNGFVKTTATNAILSIFGPTGTDDLTAASTTIPGADIAGATAQKLIPGTMAVV
jgi:hypothetical protein